MKPPLAAQAPGAQASQTPDCRRAFAELERGVKAALETYANVHRGTGHFSMVSTELYEHAKTIVLECLGLDPNEYQVVFNTAYGAEILRAQLRTGEYAMASSRDVGLPLGLRALAIRKSAMPRGAPVLTGGGVVKIVSPHSVIWADPPQKFEAGTPPVINAIALALALMIERQRGRGCFRVREAAALPAAALLPADGLADCSGPPLLAELGKRMIGRDVCVPTALGDKPFINLDNGASTPSFSPVWDAVCWAWRQPEKAHPQIIREVRKILAVFLGASPENYEVLFAGNVTEAVNIAARLVADEFKENSGLVILNSLLEHNSNELPWRGIRGASRVRMPVDPEGFVDLDGLELILKRYNRECAFGKRRIRLVALSGASNVLGTFNDLPAVSRIVHQYDARLLVDAAQVAATRSIRMDEWGIDYLAFSGHKAYAPFGSGALIARKEHLRGDHPVLAGIRASGEENIVGIAALGKAIELLQRVGMDVIKNREQAMTRRLLQGLSGIRGLRVFGIADPDSQKLPRRGGIVSFSFRGVPHNLAAGELAERGGIGVRNGCFCAHLLVKHLLRIHPARACAANAALILAPRFTGVLLPGLVRVSLGIENDDHDVDQLIETLQAVAGAPRSWRDRLFARTRNGTPFRSRSAVQERMEEFVATRRQLVFSPGIDGRPARP